jgi:hypothetical protein
MLESHSVWGRLAQRWAPDKPTEIKQLVDRRWSTSYS